MRKMWVYWFVIILIIFVFSLGIIEATEYQCYVITDTGTYKIYKAQWWELQKEFNEQVPQHKGLLVLAFSDFNRKEIRYSEDALDAVIKSRRTEGGPNGKQGAKNATHAKGRH